MANVVTDRAACGCVGAIFHVPGCKLVAGESAAGEREIFRCDVEDGLVWLHMGEAVAPIAPKRARDLGDELHACAREAEKKR